MTEEIKIEELLNSFVDGELSVRQRTEVKRMVANDPKIAFRLRQIQKCKTLVNALPVTQAPAFIMENVKASLSAKANNDKKLHFSTSGNSGKTRFIEFRRVFATAAMISLAAVLIIVINMLTPSQIKEGNSGFHAPVADMRFSGKLELKINDLKGVDSIISRAIEDSGLAGSVSSVKEAGRRVYTLNCSREGMNNLLTELNGNWDKLYSASLFMDTNVFEQSVEIDSVTPSQIAKILNQENEDQSIKVAKEVSVINGVNKLLPDNNVMPSGSNVGSSLFTIPEPVTVQHYPPVNNDNGAKTVQIRIILSR